MKNIIKGLQSLRTENIQKVFMSIFFFFFFDENQHWCISNIKYSTETKTLETQDF